MLVIHTFVSVHLLRMKRKVYILNVLLDNNHFGKNTRRQLRNCFRNCLLPEVLGNWYTRGNICSFSATDSELPSSDQPSNSNPSCSSTNTSSYTDVDEHTFCYCHGPENGLMIACDNPDCLLNYNRYWRLEMTESWFEINAHDT